MAIAELHVMVQKGEKKTCLGTYIYNLQMADGYNFNIRKPVVDQKL